MENSRYPIVREIQPEDFLGLMKLYLHLHEQGLPAEDEKTRTLWTRILEDQDDHILVADLDGVIVSSCTCVIIPNLTRGQRPYAFVEVSVLDKR